MEREFQVTRYSEEESADVGLQDQVLACLLVLAYFERVFKFLYNIRVFGERDG